MKGQTMKRAILVGAIWMLAFAGTAQAERYKCAVTSYDACRSKDGCSRTTAPNGIHYVFDTHAETLTFCKSGNKKDCVDYKAIVQMDNAGMTAAVIANGWHLLRLRKPGNEITSSWIGDEQIMYNFRGFCMIL
jgi:hypothetical protein